MSDIYGAPQSEVMKSQSSSSEGLTDTMLGHLLKAKPWAKFLGILQFIYVVLIVIGILGGAFTMFRQTVIGAIAILLFGGIFAYLMFIMASYMFRYAKSVESLGETKDIQYLEESQEQFGKYCRFFVILIAIVIIVGIAGAFFIMSIMTLNYR